MLAIVFVLVWCNEINITGTFYTLSEAYDNNFLSKDDLENTDFTPKPKNSELLDESTEKNKKMYF